MSHHTHRAVEELSRTYGWSACVAGGRPCSGRAHGGVVHVDRCWCGARRETESNGRHVVRGPWISPSLPRAVEAAVGASRCYVQTDCAVLGWDGVAGHYSVTVYLTPEQRAAAVRAALRKSIGR